MEETVVHGKKGPGPSRTLVIVLVGIIIIACIVGIGGGLILLNRQAEGAEAGEAEGSEGDEAADEELADSLPPPPSNIWAMMKTPSIFDVLLGWNDNSDNEEGFNIYRRRIDILGDPEDAGSAGEDETEFTDEGTICGATYQYTVASFNVVGESPATECWQITLAPCPTPRAMQLGVGVEYGRNFLTGELGENGDFYLGVAEDGRFVFLADQPGQVGLVDLGDVGDTPLHQVTLPAGASYEQNGVPAILGHTYAAMARNNEAIIIFTLTELGDPATLEYIIYFPDTEVIDLTLCERLGGRTPGGPCVSGDDVCDPTCAAPDPDLIGTTVPEDEPDDFEELYGSAEARYPGGALFTPMTMPGSQEEGEDDEEPPPLQTYPDPTYTPRDEDCGNQPCISGDDICNPDCATTETFRGRDDERICDEGGPDFAATVGTPYQPCGDDGEHGDTTLAALNMEGATTANRTGRYVDEDCGDPCVTGDGICDPTCMPNTNDIGRTTLAQLPCTDEDGDGQPDGCYPDDGETEPPGQPVEMMGVSLLDGDCFGPCIPDGVCFPYCDPFYVPTLALLDTTSMTMYDPDCGPPCDPASDPCTCTPVTASTELFAGLDWQAECEPSGCEEGTPCYGLGPGYPCTDEDGNRGACRDCECIPLMDCPDNPTCNNMATGDSCTTDYDVPGACRDCECVPLVTCPDYSPCYMLGPGYPCTTAAGNTGVCEDCECVYPNGCPADTDGCGQDSDCWTGTDASGVARTNEWRCIECNCRPPCLINGICEPGEHSGNCGEDCHECGDGLFTPAGGEQCDRSANINCPPEQRCDNCTRCRPADCECDGSTYVCDDDVGTRIENDDRCRGNVPSTGGSTSP